MAEERVQLFDETGAPDGSATRAAMRAGNLVHATTYVVVLNSLEQILVHRRTDTKDLYPGFWDFAAGGVMVVGEQPAEAARRELAEEVGARGVTLNQIGRAFFGDEHARCWGHTFFAEWDGQVRKQDEEIAELAWWSLETLINRIEDPKWMWMPDTVALLREWLHERAAHAGNATYHPPGDAERTDVTPNP